MSLVVIISNFVMDLCMHIVSVYSELRAVKRDDLRPEFSVVEQKKKPKKHLVKLRCGGGCLFLPIIDHNNRPVPGHALVAKS